MNRLLLICALIIPTINCAPTLQVVAKPESRLSQTMATIEVTRARGKGAALLETIKDQDKVIGIVGSGDTLVWQREPGAAAVFALCGDVPTHCMVFKTEANTVYSFSTTIFWGGRINLHCSDKLKGQILYDEFVPSMKSRLSEKWCQVLAELEFPSYQAEFPDITLDQLVAKYSSQKRRALAQANIDILFRVLSEGMSMGDVIKSVKAFDKALYGGLADTWEDAEKVNENPTKAGQNPPENKVVISPSNAYQLHFLNGALSEWNLTK